jgi:hypothetical protein
MPTDTPTPGVKRLQEVFSHPSLLIVGLIGAVASIIAVPLAFYFYFESRSVRDLVVAEQPVRSVFVSHETPEGIEVRINGQQVLGKDLFSIQMVIWNAGNESIRRENVLEPITIRTPQTAEVIRAKVVRSSRPLAEVEAKIAADAHSVRLDWRILESQDGAVVEVLVVGDPKVRLDIAGTVEGCGAPRIVSPDKAFGKSPHAESSRSFAAWAAAAGTLIAAGAGLLVGVATSKGVRTRERRLRLLLMIGGSLSVLLIEGGWHLWTMSGRAPKTLLTVEPDTSSLSPPRPPL